LKSANYIFHQFDTLWFPISITMWWRLLFLLEFNLVAKVVPKSNSRLQESSWYYCWNHYINVLLYYR